MTRKGKTVGFRLNDFYYELLEKEAMKRALSPGEYARLLVVNAIDDRDREQLKEEIAALKDDFALAVEAILMATNIPREQAREWVTENLLNG